MEKKRRFLDWSLLPVVFSLAWPTILEELLGTAVQYFDTAMVGALGTSATAAVGSTSTVNWLVLSSLSAFGVGFLAYISQACGRKDYQTARKAVMQAFIMILVVGSLFTALLLSVSRKVPVWMHVDPAIQDLASRYFFILYCAMLPRTATSILGTVLRAFGDSRTPMRVGIYTNLLNVVLNFFLIPESRTVAVFGREVYLHGAGMGVLGAAAASAAAYLFGGIAIIVGVLRHPEISPIGIKVRVDWDILKPCLTVALPNMLQRFGSSLGYVVFASLINSLGEVSTAANTVANTVESAFYVPGFGMMTAAATLTGNAIGARNPERFRDMRRMILFIEVSLMILTGSLLFAYAPQMVSLFADDPEVICLGSTVLRMVACSEPFFGASIVLEGMLQGAGETRFPFILNLLGMWCIRIGGTTVCTKLFGYGLEAAWACMIAHNLILCAGYAAYTARAGWAHSVFSRQE